MTSTIVTFLNATNCFLLVVAHTYSPAAFVSSATLGLTIATQTSTDGRIITRSLFPYKSLAAFSCCLHQEKIYSVSRASDAWDARDAFCQSGMPLSGHLSPWVPCADSCLLSPLPKACLQTLQAISYLPTSYLVLESRRAWFYLMSPRVTSRSLSPGVTSRSLSPTVTSRSLSPGVISRTLSSNTYSTPYASHGLFIILCTNNVFDF